MCLIDGRFNLDFSVTEVQMLDSVMYLNKAIIRTGHSYSIRLMLISLKCMENNGPCVMAVGA